VTVVAASGFGFFCSRVSILHGFGGGSHLYTSSHFIRTKMKQTWCCLGVLKEGDRPLRESTSSLVIHHRHGCFVVQQQRFHCATPNEILDIIFGGFGKEELDAFAHVCGTHHSARKAIWLDFCRTHSTIDKHPCMPAEFETALKQQFNKAKRLHDTIVRAPLLGLMVKELTIPIPTQRLALDSAKNLVFQLPENWDDSIVRNLLLMVPTFRKLHLVAIWVPWSAGTTHRYVTLPAKRSPIGISSTVKELHIEDVEVPDAADEEVGGRIAETEIWKYEQSDLLLHFTNYHHIERRHLKAPFFVDMSGQVMPTIQQMHGLEELRLDLSNEWGMDKDVTEGIYMPLGTLLNLHVLEVRYSSSEGTPSPFPEGWPALIPSLRVLRIPIRRFAEALLSTDSSHKIHYELLMDHSEREVGLIDEDGIELAKKEES
jgi:hypothetical protein